MENIIYLGAGERIDTRLVAKFPYSRNFFHHIIERDGISVNNKKIKKSYKLKQGDKVLIDDLSRYLSSVVLEEAPNISIPIILEKEDYLVINKPKGVLSHPNSVREVSQASVVGFLYHNYKNLPTIGNFIRAGLLHRLDKDTDGLMIVAKTEKGLSHFKKLFQKKSEVNSIQDKEKAELKKKYRAICYIPSQGEEFLSEISSQLPYYIQELVIPKVPHYTPKFGITKILSFQKLDSQKISFNIEILTGRTHQIRYHLSNHGLPIVGDYLYGKEESTSMQLTAYKLEFIDPDGEKINLEI
ncbi:RluA family pseudouridine synthase [Candidatus Gracilibacteria bacterium]|nr:RluA family pseudouridine synthase [Candidatus Gracilibacteria bacterium]